VTKVTCAIQDHIPDRGPAASFRTARRREDADRQILDWEVCVTDSGGYPALPLRIMGFVELRHRLAVNAASG
jgi:hypothetical protein